jgi:hypothetical protein
LKWLAGRGPTQKNVRLRQRNNSRSLREAVDGTIASKNHTWTYIQLLAPLCRRLDLLHLNIRKLGTLSNTVAAATKLEGVIKRKI